MLLAHTDEVVKRFSVHHAVGKRNQLGRLANDTPYVRALGEWEANALEALCVASIRADELAKRRERVPCV